MSRRSRTAIWITGAVAANWIYSEALAAAEYTVPTDVPRKLLFLASVAAAAMVGGSFAILVYDRVRRR